MEEPRIIDHNPHEKRPTNTIWWVAWPLTGVLWVGYLYFHSFDWWSVALGGGTGILLASWSVDITGNKVPSWMSGGPSRR